MNPETLNTIIKDCTVLKQSNIPYYTEIVNKYFSNAISPLIFIQLQYFNPFLLNIATQINHMDKDQYFRLLSSYIEAKHIPQDNIEE